MFSRKAPLLLVLVGIFLGGIILGFLGAFLVVPQPDHGFQPQVPRSSEPAAESEPQIPPPPAFEPEASASPIPLYEVPREDGRALTQYLAHSVMRSFSAMAEGMVVEKTDDSFTLEKDGGRVTIFVYLPESQAISVFTEKTDGGTKRIPFADVRIGDTLFGGATIVLEPDTNPVLERWGPGDLVAHQFTVIERATERNAPGH